MAIEKWHERIGENLFVYRIKSDISVDLVKKDSNDLNPLSPVTSSLLNTWSFLIEENKNFILTFPSNSLNTIPLLSYLYSKIKSKSVLVFSSGIINEKNINKDFLIKKHNRNYQLLNSGGYGYLFRSLPICNIDENSLKIEVYLPRATGRDRQRYIDEFKRDLLKSNGPKIFLNSSQNLTKVYNTLEGIYLENEEVDGTSINLDIGCIIFENADRYINSEDNAKDFIDWINDNIDRNIQLFFHFSNSNFKFIPLLKESINALVLPYNQNILKNNAVLLDSSLNYFKGKKQSDLLVLNNYNLDNSNIYNFNYNIEIVEPLLENGNLDLFLYQSNKIIKNINFNTLKNKYYFDRLFNLFDSLANLTINPDNFIFFDKNISSNISVTHFLSLFMNNLWRESKKNNFYLEKLLSTFYTYYLELSETKPYGIDYSFDRIAKDYRLLEIINNREEFFGNDKKIIIGTYHRTEPRIINDSLKHIENVEAFYLGNLLRNNVDFSDYDLLLPGVLPPYFFSILKFNFNKILILSYKGLNYNRLKYQIDLVLNPSIRDEKISMGYLKELYDFLGESYDGIFSDFENRYKDFLIKSENAYEEQDEKEDKKLTIKDLYDLESNYKGYVKSRNKIDSNLKNYSNFSSNLNNEKIKFRLFNLLNQEEVQKELIKNKKYLKFESYDKLNNAIEVKPSLLYDNEYVIVLDDNKSFLEIYLDAFNEDDFIDRELINYWKDILVDFIEKDNLSIKQFYNLYSNYCNKTGRKCRTYGTILNWVRGYTIAPSNQEDIKILAEMFEDDYLLENYQYVEDEASKLRNFNILMGRRLSSLIKSIIRNADSIDYSLLSLEERRIYDRVGSYIYEVIEKLD